MDKMTTKLGFGMMRLPRKLARIDIKQTSQMVDEFLEAGFTYSDTAYVYVGSEEATRKALVSRHPRDSFTLATKVYPKVAPAAKAAKGQLGTSLKRLGTDYIDYYLLHSITDSDYERYDRLGLWDFAAVQNGAAASSCIACGACEDVCTQNLPIIDNLAACADAFER